MLSRFLAIAVAAALTSVAGAASAADNQATSAAMSKPTVSNSSAPMQSVAQDSLSLTHRQERTAWRDISKEAAGQTPQQKFAASVGTTVPADISLQPMPADVATRISALKPYDYALIHRKLLIVNPTDKKVVDIISRRA